MSRPSRLPALFFKLPHPTPHRWDPPCSTLFLSSYDVQTVDSEDGRRRAPNWSLNKPRVPILCWTSITWFGPHAIYHRSLCAMSFFAHASRRLKLSTSDRYDIRADRFHLSRLDELLSCPSVGYALLWPYQATSNRYSKLSSNFWLFFFWPLF